MNTIGSKVKNLETTIKEVGNTLVRFETYDEWIRRVLKLPI